MTNDQLSINRNILECKFDLCFVKQSSYAVLIETYWNVNEDDLVFLKNSFSVLIETYWNVNKGVVLDSDCCTIWY